MKYIKLFDTSWQATAVNEGNVVNEGNTKEGLIKNMSRAFICTRDITFNHNDVLFQGDFLILTAKGYMRPAHDKILFAKGSEYENNIKPYDSSWINKIRIGFYEEGTGWGASSIDVENLKLALKPFGLTAYQMEGNAIIVEEKTKLTPEQFQFINQVIFRNLG